MIRRTLLASVLGALLFLPASGRTWTDTGGKTIEADIVGLEEGKVVLKFKGKNVRLPLDRLSPEDRRYVEEWRKEEEANPAPSGEPSLCGTVLKTDGGVTIVTDPLPPAALKEYSKAESKPTQLKLAIALPPGFDPAKPQHVMWTCAAINNEDERKSGNISSMAAYTSAAIRAGWVVIAVDTDIGNPRRAESDRAKGGDLEVHRHATELLAKEWPAFRTWKFACCGFSGGGKTCFYRMGHLLECKLEVVGLFLGGCNQDLTDAAKEESGFRKSGLKTVRVFISNGKNDTISTVAHAEKVRDGVEGQDYAEVRLDLYEGAHSLDMAGFSKAMEWFREPPGK
jgi:dienelactone hydrolase